METHPLLADTEYKRLDLHLHLHRIARSLHLALLRSPGGQGWLQGGVALVLALRRECPRRCRLSLRLQGDAARRLRRECPHHYRLVCCRLTHRVRPTQQLRQRLQLVPHDIFALERPSVRPGLALWQQHRQLSSFPCRGSLVPTLFLPAREFLWPAAGPFAAGL